MWIPVGALRPYSWMMDRAESCPWMGEIRESSHLGMKSHVRRPQTEGYILITHSATTAKSLQRPSPQSLGAGNRICLRWHWKMMREQASRPRSSNSPPRVLSAPLQRGGTDHKVWMKIPQHPTARPPRGKEVLQHYGLLFGWVSSKNQQSNSFYANQEDRSRATSF